MEYIHAVIGLKLLASEALTLALRLLAQGISQYRFTECSENRSKVVELSTVDHDVGDENILIVV